VGDQLAQFTGLQRVQVALFPGLPDQFFG
jgi:hypothetical protein